MFLDHLGRIIRGRSRGVSRTLVLAGAAVLALSPLGAAASASAAVPARAPAISFFAGVAKFTVGGHTWSLSISDLGVGDEVGISTTHELDSWVFFSAPASNLTVNKKTGNATFNAHNSLAPIAFFDLTFHATSRTKEHCHSGSETIFRGRTTGSVTLVANHKGLKFKAAHASFSSPILTIDNGCSNPSGSGSTSCSAGSWNVGGTVSARGPTPTLPERQTFTVGVSMFVELKSPAGTALLTDVLGTGKKPVFNSTKRKLQVNANHSSGISGSAVLTATRRPTLTTSRCTLNGKHYKANDANYMATYASPNGGQITARSILAGRLTLPRSGSASFDIITLKRV
jgi:hypothetical protein